MKPALGLGTTTFDDAKMPLLPKLERKQNSFSTSLSNEKKKNKWNTLRCADQDLGIANLALSYQGVSLQITPLQAPASGKKIHEAWNTAWVNLSKVQFQRGNFIIPHTP